MFIPKRIIFLKDSLNYEIGQNVYNYFKDNNRIEIIIDSKNVIKNHFDLTDFLSYYKEAKRTLILGVKKVGTFQSCRPSAHYQLPLISGCMGECEYCYLQTELTNKPYIKVNVNIEDILDKALEYINERPNEITIFEGSATSDILPIEPYTKILSKTITFFAEIKNARFRFVSKYNDVNNLLDIKHNNHTEIRFSINTNKIIDDFEHKTASVDKRIEAAKKVLEANYRVGFLIAPVFLYPEYQSDYYQLLNKLKEKIGIYEDKITFEVISHRYTLKAKEAILNVFPDTKLEMNESSRSFRMGQFGYGKYLYTKEDLKEMKIFFTNLLQETFPLSKVLYII